MSKKKVSQNTNSDDAVIPPMEQLAEGDLEGVLVEEVEITEFIEVHILEEEDEEFDSVFPTSGAKKLTQEELEDAEDFDSYFFEE
mgnify:CR=1 FL=1